MLLKNGADVNAKDNNGEVALHKAVCSDGGVDESCLLTLYVWGANLNERDYLGLALI